MLVIKVLKLAAVLGLAQAQGQHNGVDCAQALSDMSDDLNYVSLAASPLEPSRARSVAPRSCTANGICAACAAHRVICAE